MKIRLLMPWNNLGCLGVQVGRFYADIYTRPWARWPRLGLFVSTGRRRWWITPSGIRGEK